MKSTAALVVPGICAFAIIWFSSPWGTGTTPDSMQYLANARSWLGGESFLAWDRHLPPAYALAIGTFAGVTDDVLLAARLLQALSFGVNAVLLGLIIHRLGRGSVLYAVVAALFFVLHPDAYQIQFLTLSEGLFITFVLLHLLFMQSYQFGGRITHLALAGALLGFCVLTRYAGLAFVAASGLYVLCSARDNWWHTIRSAALFGLSALLVPVAWLVAASIVAPAEAPRSLAMHLVDTQRLVDLFFVVTGWFTFAWFEPATLLVAALSVASVIWALLKAPARERGFIALLSVTVVVYIVFLLVSISFFDFYTPLDQRILLPAFAVYWLAVAASMQFLIGDRKAGELLVCGLVLMITVSRLPTYSSFLSHNIREGQGYYAKNVRLLPIFEYLKNNGFTSVYSNAPELLSAHVNVKAVLLPRFFDPALNQPHPDYVKNMDDMLRDVEQNGAVIVYVHSFRWRTYLPNPSVFDALENLLQVYAAGDAVVYRTGQARVPAGAAR